MPANAAPIVANPEKSVPAIKIKKNALLSALEGAKNMHPDEFIALFRGNEQSDTSGKTKKGGIDISQKKDGKPDLLLTELIIPPFATGDEDSSSYSPYFIPANSSEKASFHSHPDPDTAYPSDEDLYYMARSGGVHFIACWPFRMQDVACFDAAGKPQPFAIV
ncbi:hypothetical protein HY994_04635 [Candidatus Micrarchaeota archaeon]|nr:hypothetical protein [Candidatus Micrarchaeota archaeon]